MGPGRNDSRGGVQSCKYCFVAREGSDDIFYHLQQALVFSAGFGNLILLEDETRDLDQQKRTVLAGGQELIPYDEVQKHATRGDCWVIIDVRRDLIRTMYSRRAETDRVLGYGV